MSPELPRSQCPGLALFVDSHFEMLGLGAGTVMYCYADKDGTYRASDVAPDVQERIIDDTNPAHPSGTTHAAYSAVERLYMVDHSGGLNNFEAALLFQDDYYVLGYGRTFTTPRDVVRAVFAAIEWHYKVAETESTQNDWAGVCWIEPWIEGVPTG